MDTAKNFKNPATNPVQVYCRLRPLKTPGDISSAEVKDLTTVLFPARAGSLQLKRNYVFKQVFNENASQADVFNSVARPLVERLVRGSNSLLFSYGVTGSGKTYTMTGAESQCGVLPRCLNTLFQTIGAYRAPSGTFQSDHSNGFEIATECEAKPSSSGWETIKSARSAILRRKNSDLDLNVESMGSMLNVSGINDHNIYAVFVSYVEIYNNSVYDLLKECTTRKVLHSHNVREDANHNMYTHGAVEIQINSVQEAIEVFQTGQKRKRMGQTALNAGSSRSHSVFNIRLVQAPSKKYADTDENLITISQLSLVDLAGSERSSRTNNTGVRLRETGNINNSLMKLRECLEYLRENQQISNGNVPKKIPYRDSKLTYLFKNFLEGDGQVSMIVCINPNISDDAENAQVLKFAEMTQDVQIVNTKPVALCTPLKRPAWKKEHMIQKNKIDNDCNESKIKSDPHTFDLDQFMLNQTKIKHLETQNLELRLELTRIREAYRKAMGHAWFNNVTQRSFANFSMVRKSPREALKQPENMEDFKNELKEKLLRQLTKLERNVIEIKTENKKKRSFADGEKNLDISEDEVELNITEFKQKKMAETIQDGATQNLPIAACNPIDSQMKSNRSLENENYSLGTPKIKNKFDESAQWNVLKFFTPKKSKIPEHSTPYDHSNSGAKGILDFFNEKDSDFDKREFELSLKMESHRKNLKGNKHLMDILSNLSRTKSSTSVFHKSLTRKNLFPDDRHFSDKES